MKIVSELREAMWGVVQMAISTLEVDFTAYATERGEHAIELANQDDLDQHLAVAKRYSDVDDLGPHLFVARIKQGLGANVGADVATEHADADPRARFDQLGGQVGVGDR